ncbi:MAG: hypothetical protein AAF919_06690 [Pseudomonadota bacterium]
MINTRWASADGNGGWRNHYRRMMRWSERTIKACSSDDKQSQSQVVDFALAFFVWCYSLRDWLKASEDFGEKEVAEFVSKQRYWKHCRDIALRSKHWDLSRPSIDADYGISRRKVLYSEALGSNQIQWIIWMDGDVLPLSSVVEDLTATWRSILEVRLLGTSE